MGKTFPRVDEEWSRWRRKTREVSHYEVSLEKSNLAKNNGKKNKAKNWNYTVLDEAMKKAKKTMKKLKMGY